MMHQDAETNQESSRTANKWLKCSSPGWKRSRFGPINNLKPTSRLPESTNPLWAERGVFRSLVTLVTLVTLLVTLLYNSARITKLHKQKNVRFHSKIGDNR